MKLKLGALSALILLGGCWESTGDQPEATVVEKEKADSTHPYYQTSYLGDKDYLTATYYFEFDSCKIDEVNQKLLNSVASYLKENPTEVLTIVGHADVRGSHQYNQGLGYRRANAVAEYLESLGVSKEQLDVGSKGKEEPLSAEANDSAQAINRRVVLDFA